MLDLKLFSSLFDKNIPIYIGYSGGIDSHVLLSLCVQARELNYITNQLTAIHINHGISENADLWQEHCQNICANLKVDFIARKLTFAKFNEAVAREARLEQFRNCIGEQPHNLLFAHHALDQAETVLFRLFRGTSIDGMAGMQPVTDILGLKIVRPLLNVDKSVIIEYAKQYNLQYVIDESNLTTKYSRNYIRNTVLPIIQERWPDAVAKINNFSHHCLDLREIIDDSLEGQINSSLLSIDSLQTKKIELQKYILVRWLKYNQISPSLKHIDILFNQVINAKHCANPQLKLSNKYIVRSYGYLEVLEQIEQPIIYSCQWDSRYDLYLDFLDYTLSARDAQKDFLVKIGNYGSKVKKIFQEKKIPTWERLACILLYQDKKLVEIINSKNNSVIFKRINW
jgi:tRNA(Ile)-lysidine synthase